MTKGELTYYIRQVLPDLRFLICERPALGQVVIFLDKSISADDRSLLDEVMQDHMPVTLDYVVEVLP